MASTVAAILLAAGLVGRSVAVAAPALAQTGPGFADPGTTTTTGPPVPVTTAPPVVSSTTSTTVGSSASVASATTTTTAPPSAWTASVPGPPPPAAVSASPADIARANQLEQQIVTQSNVLDVLAEQYNQAQQKVVATQAQLDQVRVRLFVARAGAEIAQANVGKAGQTLRAVAVDAYVSLGSGAPRGPSTLLATYEHGAAQVGAETALGKALDQVHQLRQAEQHLRAAETGIVAEEQQGAAANANAQAAAVQAQAAAQAATTQQQQVLATVSQVSGNLAPLVAAAHAAQAQAAFNRFKTAGGLDFQPTAALSAPSAQAATAVQAAMAQVGKPYVWGAAGPNSFDCSGLVLWAWSRVGVAIPRVAAAQQSWATPVPISQLAPGDLVFFGTPAHHVGMYVGGGLMVDAPHTGATVSVVPIWWDDLAGFGRVHG